MRFRYQITILFLVAICFTGCDKPGYQVVYAGPIGLGMAPDLSVIGIEVTLSDGGIGDLRVTFANGGVDEDTAGYKVYFSISPAPGGTARYLVKEDTISLGDAPFFSVDLPRIGRSGLPVPSGSYYIEVEIDPDEDIEEDDETNNGYITAGSYNYGRVAPIGEGFEIELDTDMPMVPFDAAHPIYIVIMDSDEDPDPFFGNAGTVRAASPGLYFVPLSSISIQDSNGSGYRARLVFDDGNDWQPGMALETGDFTAFYNTASSGNVSFQDGSVVVPGTKHFMRPELPDADEYEPDDDASFSTAIELDAVQYHNLHSPLDEDWLRFTVAESEDVIVETFSIGDELSPDTYLILYDSDFVIIDEDDDGGDVLFSQITFTAPTTGTYYVRVNTEWNGPGGYGIVATNVIIIPD
jgi:hypothetical protein